MSEWRDYSQPAAPDPPSLTAEERRLQEDPHWRDLVLCYEYFHGDNGAGLGASHQTGWTGLVARLIQSLGQFDADSVLEDRRWPMARPYRRLAAAPIAGVSVARQAGDIPV